MLTLRRASTTSSSTSSSGGSSSSCKSPAEMRVENDIAQLREETPGPGPLSTVWAVDFLASKGKSSISHAATTSDSELFSPTECPWPDCLQRSKWSSKACFQLLVCCSQGPYKDGVFAFGVCAPPRYPHEAPRIRCLNASMFHPNVRDPQRGEPGAIAVVATDICSRNWTACWTIADVIKAVQFILLEPSLTSADEHESDGDVELTSRCASDSGKSRFDVRPPLLPSLIHNEEAAELYRRCSKQEYQMHVRRLSEPLPLRILRANKHDLASDRSLMRDDFAVGEGLHSMRSASQASSSSSCSSLSVMSSASGKPPQRVTLPLLTSCDGLSSSSSRASAVGSRRRTRTSKPRQRKRKRVELYDDDLVCDDGRGEGEPGESHVLEQEGSVEGGRYGLGGFDDFEEEEKQPNYDEGEDRVSSLSADVEDESRSGIIRSLGLMTMDEQGMPRMKRCCLKQIVHEQPQARTAA